MQIKLIFRSLLRFVCSKIHDRSIKTKLRLVRCKCGDNLQQQPAAIQLRKWLLFHIKGQLERMAFQEALRSWIGWVYCVYMSVYVCSAHARAALCVRMLGIAESKNKLRWFQTKQRTFLLCFLTVAVFYPKEAFAVQQSTVDQPLVVIHHLSSISLSRLDPR